MLTRKQHELLLFVHDRIRETGVSPSFDEMKEALGLRSKSGIHRLITALEERGFVRRLPHRARALEILRLPESATQMPGGGQRPVTTGFRPSVIEGSAGRPPAVPSAARTLSDSTGKEAGTVDIPLLGRIAAGSPIEAIEDGNTSIGMPAGLITGGEHYALEVKGDSMIDAGIFDGDTAVIRRCDTADNGSIVVALIDDYEATLKRVRRKGNSIALEAANPVYETRIFGPDQVKIQGKLVGLFRRY